MYRPGESPFRTLGSTYLAVQSYADAKIEGGNAAMVAALPEGAHRDFAAQSFAKDGWYDALPLRPITETIARLEGIGWEQAIRAHALYQAKSQQRLLGRLRNRSTDKALDKLGRESLEAFDFGRAELSERGPKSVRLVFHEIPQPLGKWMLATVYGQGSVVFGQEIEASGRLIPTGQREAMGLVEVRVELRWS